MRAFGMAIGCALVWSCSCGGGGSEFIADYVFGRYVTCDRCGKTRWLGRAPSGLAKEGTDG